MEEIIKPVSKELLKAELTEDKRLRMTNKSNNLYNEIKLCGIDIVFMRHNAFM